MAVFVVAGTAASVGAQWPTGCVELNDIVERHLENAGSVGIYQRVFGEQAEGACQSDHREDVARAFAWALAGSTHPDAGSEPSTFDAQETTRGWPATCVELNDIVENSLGNDRNVGIYQRTFGEQAEPACRQDHADNVRAVFGWAAPCDVAHAAVAPADSTATGPLPVYQLAHSEPALQMVLVRLPWLACHVYPWLQDGVSGHDFRSLDSLLTLADINESFAMELASYPWFVDGVHFYREAEWGALRDLTLIAREFPELLSAIRDLSWITEERPDPTGFALLSLTRLAETSVELAILAATSPWMNDGVEEHEAGGIAALGELAKQDLSLTRQLLEYTLTPTVTAIDVLLLDTIELMRRDDPQKFNLLVNQPWFVDGLDATERAFIAGIPWFVPAQYFQHPDSRYYRSLTTTLPVSGETTLWAFDFRPLPEGEDVLELAAEAARELEKFMGIPFPIGTIIFRFNNVDPLGFSALFSGDHILVGRESNPILDRSDQASVSLVYHEMAHYFFNHFGPYYSTAHASPSWVDEGAATFMEAYISDRLGHRPLRSRFDQVMEAARSDCMEHGLENILKLTIPNHPDTGRWLHCNYVLGEYMIFSLYYAMGEAGLSAAFREVYVTGKFFRPFPQRHSMGYPSDLQLFQTFLKHTPPDRKDAVREVYRRIHGGPYIPPDN